MPDTQEDTRRTQKPEEHVFRRELQALWDWFEEEEAAWKPAQPFETTRSATIRSGRVFVRGTQRLICKRSFVSVCKLITPRIIMCKCNDMSCAFRRVDTILSLLVRSSAQRSRFQRRFSLYFSEYFVSLCARTSEDTDVKEIDGVCIAEEHFTDECYFAEVNFVSGE